MKKLRVLYVCDFNLHRYSGKDRATRQKLDALGALVDLRIISASGWKASLKFFAILWIEGKAVFELLVFKPDAVISRGYVGWLFQFIAKLRNIKTVREVHSDILGESKLLPYTGLRLFLIKILSSVAHKIDQKADLRIFNHPDLKKWYSQNVKYCESDVFVYNGYDPEASSNLRYDEALAKFGLDGERKYLVFVGGASKWHGVEYLVKLQEEFDRNNDGIKIVCGGGDLSEYDLEQVCINFTPLDDRGCADLIKLGSMCLLPVMSNRVSPGSPLKLYDYICNKRYVVAPLGVLGYADEVVERNLGCCVDFAKPSSARLEILEFMQSKDMLDESLYPDCEVEWRDRMSSWLKAIE